MKAFSGFQDSETFTAFPDTLFRELLGMISSSGELKVVLHAVWSVGHLEGPVKALTLQDFSVADLGLGATQIQTGLKRAVGHGILLRMGTGKSTRYLVNSPQGRATAKAMEDGTLGLEARTSSAPLERPNIFKLYEENIGPLTPLIADALKDAEAAFRPEWIVEAIELAVRNNKRSWSYCQAILRRWKEEGRGKKQNRRDDQAARQRDGEEKFKRFIRG